MRKLTLLLLLVFLMVAGVTAAQTEVFCGDLSQADCALLKDSQAVMQELESAGLQIAVDFSMNNPSPGRGAPDTINFQLELDGAYAVDKAAMPEMLLKPEDLAANMEQFPEMFEGLLKAINADGNLVIHIPAEMAGLSPAPLPEEAGFSFRLVDGVAYVNLEGIGILDRSGTLPKGWLGIEFAELYQKLLEQQSGGIFDTLNVTPFMNLGSQMDEAAQQFMTVERLEDITIDGQKVAVFKTTMDMEGMMSSPAFEGIIRATMKQAIMSTSEMTETQVEGTVTEIMPMMALIFKGYTMEVTEAIGLEDHYSYQTTINMVMPMDMSKAPGMEGRQAKPLDLTINIQVTMNQFNNAPEITAPKGATMIPIEGILQGMPQMQ